MKQQDNLMQAILQPTNLRVALNRVVSNGGVAGVDGRGVDALEDFLKQHWEDIKKALLLGHYRPAKIKGLTIPKSKGGTRLLGIPTVLDRFIQQAIHQVLSRVFEPEFSEFSYGFRPNRSAQDALAKAQQYINQGYQQVIDLDLKSFFDRVNHDKLMSLLRRGIKDKVLLRLIRRYLQSGMVINGKAMARRQGTPQGGPLSPLLSNILLNELDGELEKRGHRFVRYADDCSIFVKSRSAALRVKDSITRFLNRKLLLTVNEQKTSICRPVQFKLLGHGFVSTYRKGEKGAYRLNIAADSWKRLKMKIKVITRKTSPIPLNHRIKRLQELMRGWVQYFKQATGYQKLKDLDAWIRRRLRYCIWKQWKRPRRRLRAFLQLGVSPSWARRYAYSRKGGWQLAGSPVMETTVTEERLRKRGYVPFLEYFLQVKYGKSVC